jgi:phosphonate transport system substrate-binding protein
MYFVPSVDAEGIALSADKITSYLEYAMSQRLHQGERAFYIESAIPTSYIAVVEAFGSNKADFSALNTFSYILAHDIKEYPLEAVLSVVRGEDERTYRGEIITHVASGIERLEDLQGKKFAFTDPASTAGFIMPSKLLHDRGIEIGEHVFGNKHDVVVTMVYQRQVDAGACYYSPPKTEITAEGDTITVIRDARAKVLTQFPDVAEKVKILAFTGEIPNDPWVVRTNIFADRGRQEAFVEALVSSLLEFAATEEGKQALEELYSVSGLVRADDSTYDPLRDALGSSGVDLEELLGR